MSDIVIAIDGYSGTGKSSTAKAVAKKLGYAYVDTGAMYRAVTYYFQINRVNLTDEAEIENRLNEIELDFKIINDKSEIYLNTRSIETKIREQSVSDSVSAVAAVSAVRRRLVDFQQKMGKQKRLVMDGRDIGTVVFPDSELKIFMSAEVTVRAERRFNEMKEAGLEANLEEVKRNLIERDAQDTSREDSPLIRAEDAIEVDTSDLTFDEQVDRIVKLAENKINAS
ncbi:MAG: (d)CMP kinase [Cyclobacteriaceae bacterium]